MLTHAEPPGYQQRQSRATPKLGKLHGRWLNVAESELSVLTRQALGGRLDSLELVAAEARVWADDRNETQIPLPENRRVTEHWCRYMIVERG